MPYCKLCNEWLGFMNTDCDNERCDLTSKLIDLYGILYNLDIFKYYISHLFKYNIEQNKKRR